MTPHEIVVEALHDPQNWDNGRVKWNWVDSDLWLHPDAANYSDQELYDALNNFPDEEVPSFANGGLYVHPFTDMDGTTEARVSLKNPRVTHPLP
tara:strand:+ start:326 stop:607 length:282 start_codon:yes stop_codon:yes gene_type:complete